MGKKRIPNASQLLFEAHKIMEQKFAANTLKKDVDQAKILTNFLSTLKKRSIERSFSEVNINKDIYDLILDNIRLPNNRTLYNLFRRQGRNN